MDREVIDSGDEFAAMAILGTTPEFRMLKNFSNNRNLSPEENNVIEQLMVTLLLDMMVPQPLSLLIFLQILMLIGM